MESTSAGVSIKDKRRVFINDDDEKDECDSVEGFVHGDDDELFLERISTLSTDGSDIFITTKGKLNV